ncbi:hypothetical protein EVAR_66112_1 [Eumeta japonica]|uniref:Uncharacterized protein n=1 Tax=Eumeta variegata TaxID=151549 RepID=A0A4C2A7C0_EUMVA|nr:hypothetical protein EVAR_66112_1 [Eumeta japonica]
MGMGRAPSAGRLGADAPRVWRALPRTAPVPSSIYLDLERDSEAHRFSGALQPTRRTHGLVVDVDPADGFVKFINSSSVIDPVAERRGRSGRPVTSGSGPGAAPALATPIYHRTKAELDRAALHCTPSPGTSSGNQCNMAPGSTYYHLYVFDPRGRPAPPAPATQ